MNSILRKIFVFIIAKISSPFAIFLAKICVATNKDNTNIINNSIEKKPKTVVIRKNQNENPAVTASDLNLGEEAFILNWINECN